SITNAETRQETAETSTQELENFFVEIPSTAQVLLDQADQKLSDAEAALGQSDYGQATLNASSANVLYTQANAALPTVTVDDSDTQLYTEATSTTTREVSILTITNPQTRTSTQQTTIVVTTTNNTGSTTNITVRETIPKDVAQDASELTFYPAGLTPEIIEADPVVEWTFYNVPPGEERTYGYTTENPATQSDYAQYSDPTITLIELECTSATDCDDGNSCTINNCSAGFCVDTTLPDETTCGTARHCINAECVDLPLGVAPFTVTDLVGASATVVPTDAPELNLVTQIIIGIVILGLLAMALVFSKYLKDKNAGNPPNFGFG
ncbi:MAG: hypothetical protein GOV15_00810, partial [Candidatus Diapherotrites archaeon]|nr:hypothetical protein [Candidatus Diapherotrites archaeon]